MTKLHFEDLTQITCPYGMLDDDTKERFEVYKKSGGTIEIWTSCNLWENEHLNPLNRSFQDWRVYRAKPKPKRLVSLVQWDDADLPLCCVDYEEAAQCIRDYGGYIYRIERDEDGSNPTIELVKVGGNDA
jgi:hypothetical protein